MGPCRGGQPGGSFRAFAGLWACGVWPKVARKEAEPGYNGVLVYYAGLDTVSLNRLDGDDFYQVVLWPTDTYSMEPRV